MMSIKLAVAGIVAVSACQFIVSREAMAQYALGAGDRHDRNLATGGGGRNYPQAVQNFMARNDIVTGDVAAGKAFRGDVGYTSPLAFRGTVGSDAIFGFRADSALSSPAAILRGLRSDQYSLATASAPITFSRDTTPTNPIPGATRSERRRDPIDARTVIERTAISGTSTRVIQQSWGGSVVGGMQDATGRPFAVLGSSVTGLRYEPTTMGELRPLELGLYDRRRIIEDDAAGRLGDSAPGAAYPRLGEPPPASQGDGGTSAAPATSPDRLDFSVEGSANSALPGSGLGTGAGSTSGTGSGTKAGSGAAGTGAAGGKSAADRSGNGGASSLKLGGERADRRINYRAGSANYDAIVKDLIERYKKDPNMQFDGDAQVRARLEREIEQLRDQLSGRSGVAAGSKGGARLGGASATPGGSTALLTGGAAGTGVTGASTDSSNVGAGAAAAAGAGVTTAPGGSPLRPGVVVDPNAAGTTPPTGPDGRKPNAANPTGANSAGAKSEGATSPLTIEQMATILRHGVKIEDLSTEQRSRIDELIARGQTQMGAGDFFDASQSFERALRMMPGHPMATAGVINAEIAAGLYLSSAIRLRRFLAESPEMIDTRYGERLLPPKERFDVAIENMRRRMKGSDDAPDYGLALAYIGRQTEDKALMREGLDAIKGSEADDTLRLLLKKLWLGE